LLKGVVTDGSSWCCPRSQRSSANDAFGYARRPYHGQGEPPDRAFERLRERAAALTCKKLTGRKVMESRVTTSDETYYLAVARRTRELAREEEAELFLRWRSSGDPRAANSLARAHLKQVVVMAMKLRRYGVPVSELVAEGNVGVVHALARFQPERGVRFSTYANYWVRAQMLAHVVKRLRDMLQRLDGRDVSLDAKTTYRLLDHLVGADDQEQEVFQRQVSGSLARSVHQAVAQLDPRERFIVERRLLADSDEQVSLAGLARTLGVSRERARQLEGRAKAKLKRSFSMHPDPILREWVESELPAARREQAPPRAA
jgi:RNA polymerase sigma-32 factor